MAPSPVVPAIGVMQATPADEAGEAPQAAAGWFGWLGWFCWMAPDGGRTLTGVTRRIATDLEVLPVAAASILCAMGQGGKAYEEVGVGLATADRPGHTGEGAAMG